MRTAVAAITMLMATACVGAHHHGPLKVQDWTEAGEPASPETRATEALVLEDLTHGRVTTEAAEAAAARSLPGLERCASVESVVAGSFTGPKRRQAMVSVYLGGCEGKRGGLQLVYEGGREVWRAEGATARRAFDVDGDGVDEWVETSSSCRDPQCSTEAWMVGKDGSGTKIVAHVREAELDFCDTQGEVRWTSVGIIYRSGKMTEVRNVHWRKC